MYRNRTLVTNSTLATLLTSFVLAATACSANDSTAPQLDASALSTVANRFSWNYFTGVITILPTTATLAVGTTLTLDGTIKSLSGVDLTSTLGPDATLTSSDTTIATVSNLGVVTGLKEGVVTITAQLGWISGTSKITVGQGSGNQGTGSQDSSSQGNGGQGTSPPAGTVVTILPATATLAVGATLALNGNVKGPNGVDLTATLGPEATLTSSDETIATVSSRGIITGLKSGVATITAQLGALSSTSTITVVGGQTSSGSGQTTSTDPSAPSSQSGPGLSGLALVSDDYSHYGSTADLLANISTNVGGTGSPQTALYNDGGGAQLATIDKAVTYNGHATVKYSQPAGNATTPELWVDFPGNKTLTSMWFRAKVRFSPGFTTTGTLTGSANAYKLLGWGWSGSDGRGSIEITNTNEYQLYWYVFGSGGGTIAGGNIVDAGLVNTEWTDGAWYDYIVQYQQTSSTSAVAKTWIQKDGDPFVLRATSTGTGPDGSIPGIGSVMLGINFNQVRTSTQSQAIWIGEWEVIDGSQYSNPFGISGI